MDGLKLELDVIDYIIKYAVPRDGNGMLTYLRDICLEIDKIELNYIFMNPSTVADAISEYNEKSNKEGMWVDFLILVNHYLHNNEVLPRQGGIGWVRANTFFGHKNVFNPQYWFITILKINTIAVLEKIIPHLDTMKDVNVY